MSCLGGFIPPIIVRLVLMYTDNENCNKNLLTLLHTYVPNNANLWAYGSSRGPILQEISTDHRKSTNNAKNTAHSGQHQKVHKDIDDIPPHPHHKHTTHFLRGWSKSTPTHSTIFHTLKASPPARAITLGSSTSLTDWAGLEGLCQAKGESVAIGQRSRGRAHSPSTAYRAREQYTVIIIDITLSRGYETFP